MNIFNYVKSYNYTFEEKEFNEVDNLIFSALSYVDFNNIVSYNNKNKITLYEASNLFFKNYKKKNYKYDILAPKIGIKLLSLIKYNKRFKDVLVYNYKYIGDESSQFSAITFEYVKNEVYVAFEGTDKLISGWEEDAKMAYMFPVPAHDSAIKYLNENFTFSMKKIIVGGHSKGGNLALISSMFCNPFVKLYIKKIYSNDGQGLRKDEIETKRYKKVQKKYIHIIPYNTLVGILLRHEPFEDAVIVDSKALMPMSHSITTWKLNNDKIIRRKISKSSKKIDKILTNWFNKYDYETRKFFIQDIFDILRKNNITDLSQIKRNYLSIFKLLKDSNELNIKSKEMINDLFDVILEINFNKQKKE